MADGEEIQPTEKVCKMVNYIANNDLILYSYHHCFHSQKVLMALYEKKIPFTIKTVNIMKGEQYHLWYLKINPRGEVPVLKDGIKYIPDSGRIIDYLEDNFSNGEHSRLIPLDQGSEIKKKVIELYSDLDSIPINIITLGSVFYNEFCSNLRYPFIIPSVRTSLKASGKTGSKTIREIAANLPDYKETLLEKADDQDIKYASIFDKNEFFRVLQQINELLDKVEKQFLSQESKSNFWLFTDRFTIADIALTLLLDRLSRIGLENYFWGKGKRPIIDKYYHRVQKRDSYKKTMPTFMTDISMLLKAKAPLLLGVGLLTVFTVMVGGLYYLKKIK